MLPGTEWLGGLGEGPDGCQSDGVPAGLGVEAGGVRGRTGRQSGWLFGLAPDWRSGRAGRLPARAKNVVPGRGETWCSSSRLAPMPRSSFHALTVALSRVAAMACSSSCGERVRAMSPVPSIRSPPMDCQRKSAISVGDIGVLFQVAQRRADGVGALEQGWGAFDEHRYGGHESPGKRPGFGGSGPRSHTQPGMKSGHPPLTGSPVRSNE